MIQWLKKLKTLFKRKSQKSWDTNINQGQGGTVNIHTHNHYHLHSSIDVEPKKIAQIIREIEAQVEHDVGDTVEGESANHTEGKSH